MLTRKDRFAPFRIAWYLARHHDIKISDATDSRILKRNGVNRLSRSARKGLRHPHIRRGFNGKTPYEALGGKL